MPEIDLFASRLNKQVERYISWKIDPGPLSADAFTCDWSNLVFYAFPPFTILSRVVQKIRSESAVGLLVFPQWPTRSWYPMILRMCTTSPPQEQQTLIDTATPTRGSAPIVQQNEPPGMLGVRQLYERQDLSARTISLLMNSRRDSTKKTVQYLSNPMG